MFQDPYGHSNPKLIDLGDIEKYTLEDYGFTVDSVKMNHFGIDVTDPRTGEHLPDNFYKAKLESAVSQVEKRLDIVILPRYKVEHHDFYRNDFESNMYLHMHQKPVLQVEKVRMEYGGNTVYNYPPKWWRVYHLAGHIEMLPTLFLSGDQGGPLSLAHAYSGYPMVAGVPNSISNQSAPQLFHVEYVAGMLPPKRSGVAEPHEMPADLWDLVVKIALIEVFEQYGRLIIGPGIAGMTMDIDNVKQTIETTQSAMYGGASAEIEQLNKDIEGLYANLQSYYGINLGII